MSLFQNAVLNKYLKELEPDKVNAAYKKFKTHFHNPEIQKNIRDSKEEQYQGEFLIDLFVNVLGYTKNPTPEFNLTTELKNIKGSKKTDGAILSREHAPLTKALAVIELKGTNTTDLSKVESQAFGYKNNQPGCHYVITSNFEKLRFYIDNAVDFEEFNLFQLTKERFDILWLCLSSEYLLKDIPKKIKDESLTQEENVTKKLYKDYASFRNEIFDAIQKENPEYDKLTLFKKTQKLLDRFLFIFFAEDRLLLPPNSIRSIVNQWTDLRDKYDEYFPLYDRFKKYFGYMNTGHKGQQHHIFAYNGGLFAQDDILDNIKINDELLYKHTLNLSNYDFESEVSVNILGHIFEHSLNDIDEIQSELSREHAPLDNKNKQTKRKKDGVFYTPKYITKYIVDNTVGKLCEEKKTKLDIQEAEYEKERKGRQKTTLKKLSQKLEDYRKWLLQITICDPACGSGAFLNQALEFLIAEHQYIDELQAKLFGDAMVLNEVENAILENNLFGVDINEESVDIAKLSLWLRTAQKGRKLTSLNNNIKCGNSLINDPTVAGDKAFNWQTEFPNIFKEKDKKAYHITTALHDSRTSQRMIDYKVRERREMGTNPWPNYTQLTTEEELLITKEVITIAKEDQLNIMAFNVCGDHIHLLLVCEEEEKPKIVQKIKAKTARAINIQRGITTTMEHAPLAFTDTPLAFTDTPLPLHRGKKQNSLWTQKYGSKEIKDDKQLLNTINYIQTNRKKHELPHNKTLETLLSEPVLNSNYNKAFSPEYKGGFDVVIGNPPYVRQELIDKNDKSWLSKSYSVGNGTADLYVYFIELGIKALKTNGLLGFINPNKFIKASYGKNLKQFLSKLQIEQLIDFGELNVFEDAVTSPLILIISNKYFNYDAKYLQIQTLKNLDINFSLTNEAINLKPEIFQQEKWNLISKQELSIINKVQNNGISIADNKELDIKYGLKTGYNDAFIISEEAQRDIITKDPKSAELIKKFIDGDDVRKFEIRSKGKHLICIPSGYTDLQGDFENEDDAWLWLKTNFSGIAEFLEPFKEKAKKRTDKGKYWWELRACDYYNLIDNPKIIYPEIAMSSRFAFDEKSTYINKTIFLINSSSLSLLGLLNSKLIWYYLMNICASLGDPKNGGRLNMQRIYLETISFPESILKEDNLKEVVSKAREFYSSFTEIRNSFLNLIQNKYSVSKPSKKFQNWPELDFGEFLKELEKARKKEAKKPTRGFNPLHY